MTIGEALEAARAEQPRQNRQISEVLALAEVILELREHKKFNLDQVHTWLHERGLVSIKPMSFKMACGKAGLTRNGRKRKHWGDITK